MFNNIKPDNAQDISIKPQPNEKNKTKYGPSKGILVYTNKRILPFSGKLIKSN